MNIKDKIYNYAVRKNGRVWYEYERYVMEHIGEHKKHRFRHIWILIKLNWFYRVKKGNTPYLYWDVPLVPHNAHQANNENSVESIVHQISATESESYSSWKEVHLIKRFLAYEYSAFDVFNALIYLDFSDKRNLYREIGNELKISTFDEVRVRAEKEIEKNINRKKRDIYSIYERINIYTGLEVEVGVRTEIECIKKYSHPNEYVKFFYDMLSYNTSAILATAETYYSKEQIKDILETNGYNISDIFVKESIGIDFFAEISDAINTDKIIYLSADTQKSAMASNAGWGVWKYRDANKEGHKYRVKNVSKMVGDITNSMINQHLYCGRYSHSEKRELGYKYLGVFVTGFIRWIEEQSQKYKPDRILFLAGTNNIRKYCDVDNSEVLYFSEEVAVRCISKEDRTALFRYYIDRNKNRENSVAYYLSLMGIETLSSSLYRYGLNMTDIVVKDNAVYDALLSFISDNMEQIVSIYTSEIEAVTCYLKSFDFNNEIIWVINPCGNGRVGQALNCLINDVMSCNCSIKEITALQTIDMNDSIYAQGLLETYISSYGNALNGLKLPINQSVINYINTVLSSRIPRIKSITNENGLFKFNFEDAYPWRYGAVEEIQRGIRDFIIEYEKIEERIGINLSIQAEDVSAVLGQLFEMQDYLKKNIPLILV